MGQKNNPEDKLLVELAYYHLNCPLRELIWCCNFNREDADKHKCLNKFWQDVLGSWYLFNYNEPDEENEIVNQIIWYNSNIRVADQVIFNKHLYEKGIVYIKDLVFEQRIITYEELCNIFEITYDQLNVLTYNSIVTSIPREWRVTACCNDTFEYVPRFVILSQKRKWSSSVYWSLNTTD